MKYALANRLEWRCSLMWDTGKFSLYDYLFDAKKFSYSFGYDHASACRDELKNWACDAINDKEELEKIQIRRDKIT